MANGAQRLATIGNSLGSLPDKALGMVSSGQSMLTNAPSQYAGPQILHLPRKLQLLKEAVGALSDVPGEIVALVECVGALTSGGSCDASALEAPAESAVADGGGDSSGGSSGGSSASSSGGSSGGGRYASSGYGGYADNKNSEYDAYRGEDVPTDTAAVDTALDMYWAQKREIKSIQKRLFLKNQRSSFSIYSGTIPNDDFFMYFPMGARWNYYFSEDFAVEAWGEYLIVENSDLEEFLEANFNQSLLVDVPQALKWMAGADILWSPLHGKLALFTSKLAHFDFHLAFGAGAIGTDVAKPDVIDAADEDKKSKTDISGNVGVGFRLYFNDLISMRVDYRQYFYPAEGGGISHPAEITAGVSIWTQGPQ
jgi:outer membrane beta-barrel protein